MFNQRGREATASQQTAKNANAYATLNENLRTVMVSLETYTRSEAFRQLALPQQMRIAMFQGAIRNLQKECLKENPLYTPQESWQKARELIRSIDFVMPSKATALANPLEGIAALFPDTAADEKTPVAAPAPAANQLFLSVLPGQTVDEVRQNEETLKKKFNVKTLEALELSEDTFQKQGIKIAAESPEVIMLMLNAAVQHYIKIAESFLGDIKPEFKERYAPDYNLTRVEHEHFKTPHNELREIAIQDLLRSLQDMRAELGKKLTGRESPEERATLIARQLDQASMIVSTVRATQAKIQKWEPKFDPYKLTGMGMAKQSLGKVFNTFKKVSITEIFNLDRKQAPTIQNLVSACAKAYGVEQPIPQAPKSPESPTP